MYIRIALIISVLLQFSAAFISIGLIRKTKFNVSWILISAAFFIMAIRRLLEFYELKDINPQDISASSWLAVGISIALFVGVIFIRRIFNFQERMDKMQKEQESKILSAIIQTEEKERRSFAANLHDGLGPLLSGIKMTMSSIDIKEINNSNQELIYRSQDNIDYAISSLKEISNNLSPHILKSYGVERAMKRFIDRIGLNDKTEIDFHSNLNDLRFDYQKEIIIYRVLCELLNNTLKHADASNIQIELINLNNTLSIQYSDNGKGFDIEEHWEGMGMSNIKSRIKSVNGKIDLHSKLGKGLFIQIEMDL